MATVSVEVKNGVVKCIVSVEIDFHLSDEGIEELMNDGYLPEAWHWSSWEERKEAKENAKNYDNDGLDEKVKSRLAEIAFDKANVAHLVENELCSVTSDLGELSVQAVWVQ